MENDENSGSNGLKLDLKQISNTNLNSMLSYQGCIQVPYKILFSNGKLDLSKCIDLNTPIVIQIEYKQGIPVLRLHLNSDKVTLGQLSKYVIGIPQ